MLHFPFDNAKVTARCRGMAQRARGFSWRKPADRALSLDREARVFGRSLNLTGKAFAVLEPLTLRRCSVARKDEMLSQQYSIDEPEPDPEIIEVFISECAELDLHGVGRGRPAGGVGRGRRPARPRAARCG